jgi:hypothetical protein
MVDLFDAAPERDAHGALWRIPPSAWTRSAGQSRRRRAAQSLFVPGDAVAIDKIDEILRRVAAERRLGEMRLAER